MRALPLNVPFALLLSVMVSVSVAPLLGSAMVTPENGWTCASEIVVCPATVPVMVGAAGSVSISVEVVGVLEPGAPAAGVKTSAASSLLMVAGAAAARL